MKGILRGRYTKEFREEAVRLVLEEKISCHEAGRRLSLAPSTIINWVKVYKASTWASKRFFPVANSNGVYIKLPLIYDFSKSQRIRWV